ncbi:MAG TPA: hypothetical protein VHE30_14315, partial [Polyangiaceae bacterium]|nr:hypothetical protein [Polyangiaceae bacterium]
MTELAQALLDAHVHYEVSRLRGASLDALIDERLHRAFEWLETVELGEVVTREQIVGVIERYVIELRVSGGITELAGEMANVVFSSRVSASTRVGDMVEVSSYEDFAEKIVSLSGVHQELVRYLMQSEAFATLASRVVSRVLLDLILESDEGRRAPPLKAVVLSVVNRAVPGFERRLGAALSAYVERHAARFTREGEKHLRDAVDPVWVRQMADEFWDAVSTKPLSDATRVFTPQDLEDFVVLGYEFWQKFRKTPYFHAVVTDVVRHLFEKYGRESLASLIGDMGVTEQMVSAELRTFLGPLFEHAFRTGFLEQEVRAHLAPF